MKLSFKYILNQFLSTNLSIFFVLFSIVSMIFFIQLARITQSIEISFLDLLKLYGFMLPRVLIFTLPTTFFIALTLTFYRLSRENESIVLFTLGFSPMLLAKFFLKIAAFLSALMLFTALVMIPIVFELQDNFVNYKKNEVKFSYKIGEFGQTFLNWMIFIKAQKNDTYENIILYHPKKSEADKEQLIIAKSATLTRSSLGTSLSLKEGKIYNFNENQSLFAGDFESLEVNSEFENKNLQIRSFYEYWDDLSTNKDRAKEFIIYASIALFPLASTLFALSFGIVTYRYEKGFIYLGMLSVIAFYFGVLNVFSSNAIFVVASVFLVTFLASFFCFKKMILKRY